MKTFYQIKALAGLCLLVLTFTACAADGEQATTVPAAQTDGQIAAPPEAPSDAPPASGSESGAAASGDCYPGCTRWDNYCDVDNRGKYQCTKRCMAFGQICPK